MKEGVSNDGSGLGAGPGLPQAAYWNGPVSRLWVEFQERLDALFAQVSDAALDAARPMPGEHALDVGCGCGATVLALARRVGAAGRVTGVDVSTKMLDRAGERVAAAGLSGVELTLADAGTLTIAAESIDLIFSQFGVMFFSDPIAAFSHLRRALKPSGRVVLLCPRTAAENRYISEAMQAARPLLPPGAMPPVSPDEPGMFSFADPARVRRILEGAGLHDVALLPLDRPMRLGGPGGASDAAAFSMQFGPLPRILAAAGPQLHDVVLAATVERYRALETADGVTLAGAFWIVTARR